MKKLLDQLRLWLIVKLGGFTEQYIYKKTTNYKYATVNPVRLKIMLRASTDVIHTSPLAVHEYKARLASALVKELMKRDDLILFQSEEDLGCMSWVMRAEIAVMPARDLSWLKGV